MEGREARKYERKGRREREKWKKQGGNFWRESNTELDRENDKSLQSEEGR